MTLAAGRVAYRQRGFAMGVARGGVRQDEAEPGRVEARWREARPLERSDAGRDRRPGGLPPGAARASTRVAAATATLVRGARGDRHSGRSSPSSTRRAWARPCPRSPSTCRGGDRRSRRSGSQRGRGRRLRPRLSAIRCWSCGIEAHVCVNQTAARPARRGRRGARRGGRGRLAHGRTTATSACARWSARARTADERRDGAVRAPRRQPTRRSSRRSRRSSNDRATSDERRASRVRPARGRHPLRRRPLRRGGRRRWARWSSTPR